MYLVLYPLLIINGFLDFFRDLKILFIVLVLITMPLRASLVFIYGILYSILESLNYSKFDSLESPDDLLDI
jgi:hypothetical protein